MLLEPMIILSLMLLPGICLLATSFVVSLFENNDKAIAHQESSLVRAELH